MDIPAVSDDYWPPGNCILLSVAATGRQILTLAPTPLPPSTLIFFPEKLAHPCSSKALQYIKRHGDNFRIWGSIYVDSIIIWWSCDDDKIIRLSFSSPLPSIFLWLMLWGDDLISTIWWSYEEAAMIKGWCWKYDQFLPPLFCKCIPGSTRSEKAAAAAFHHMTHHPGDVDDES